MAVDVLVIGAGITGLTTAYLLKQAGVRVAVVDQSIGSGETSHTTAHVTFVTDARLNELASRLGKKAAQAFWGAGYLAMRQIEAFPTAKLKHRWSGQVLETVDGLPYIRPSRRMSISGHRIFWQWNDPWNVFRYAYSRPYYGTIQSVGRVFRA